MDDNVVKGSAAGFCDMAPSPGALVESLRSIGYTVQTALADIVDNSIGAGAMRVLIRFGWNDGHPWVAILDDGKGMSQGELQEAMRFGCTSPSETRSRSDLGRFGLGLKTASISQCRRVTVLSKSDNGVAIAEWDLDFLVSGGANQWMLKIPGNRGLEEDALLHQMMVEFLDSCSSGTAVVWRVMDAMLAGTEPVDSEQKFSELMDGARKHLEMVFHRFLVSEPGHKRIQILFNNDVLEPFDPFGPEISSRRELTNESWEINGEKVHIQPYVLPHPDMVSNPVYSQYAGEEGYLQNQGFWVYRNRRLIVKATWFGLIRKEELNKLVRVRVDFPSTLDAIWGINIDKSQVKPPEVIRKKLKKVVQRIAEPGRQVLKVRATKVQQHGRTTVWNRYVRDGRYTYSINEEHPLIKVIIEDSPPDRRSDVRSLFKMIASSFPYEVLYCDAADDKLELSRERVDIEAVGAVCLRLIDALRACGAQPETIKENILQIEVPGLTAEIVDQLLMAGTGDVEN